jgi:organic hydroperoxide reductase OsmC/OhrA
MSEHRVTVLWTRTSPDFTSESYNRTHEIDVGLGSRIPGSSAPEFRGHVDRLDPERALVSALSSCHMLTFLAIAARKRLTLDGYEDHAVGYLEKNSAGKLAVTRVILRPKVIWAEGVAVSADDLANLHRLAHGECFIANSVKTDVQVESQA